MNITPFLRGGAMTASFVLVTSVFVARMAWADAPMQAATPAGGNAGAPASSAVKVAGATAGTKTVPRLDPLEGKTKPLHFAAEGAGDAALALEKATTAAGVATDNMAVGPAIAMYSFDLSKLAQVGGGMNTIASQDAVYLITYGGQPFAMVKRPAANGTLQTGGIQMMAGNRNSAVMTPVFREMANSATMGSLAAMDKVKSGSYEVRLILSQPPGLPSVLWLKAEAGGTDLIYPLSSMAPATLKVHELYTTEEYVKAIRPLVRERMGMPAQDPIWASDEEMNHFFTEIFKKAVGAGMSRMGPPSLEANDTMQLNLRDNVPGVPAASVRSYGVESMELIGIAKHDTPVAFVTFKGAMHDMMNPTMRFPTRPLTDFEQKALIDLLAGANVTAQEDKDGRIVVGAIRAEESCIKCHDGAKAGDVLGAFSYKLYKFGNPTTTSAAGVSAAKPWNEVVK